MIGHRLGSPVLLVALAVLAASFAAGCGGAGAPTGGVATGPGETGAGAVSASPAPTIATTPIDTPAPASTPASTPIASTAQTPEETAMPFTLTSPAFAEGRSIPSRYTCDGRDLSPPLAWSGAPDGTASLALIVDDPDARGFVHWVAFGIEGAAGTLAEGISTAAGAPAQGRNDFRRTGYGGPCPPSGTHRYDFTLYALDARLALPGSPTAAEVRSAMSGHVLARTTLRGTYRR